jgi:small subunit ribosomal protein S9
MNQIQIISQGVGRRKSAIAKIQILPGTGRLIINQQSGLSYLQENPTYLLSVQTPKDFLKFKNDEYDTIIQVNGGGLSAQASAIQLGISRALCQLDRAFYFPLKQKGFLTRDARVKERKKYGLKKARKAPQYSKR